MSESLVYIENKLPNSDVDGYTYISRSLESNGTWDNILVITDTLGNILSHPKSLVVSTKSVVSNRPFRDKISPKFYHFTDNNKVLARGFVIKTKTDRPLETTSRTALGSGVYGRYISQENNIRYYLTEDNQIPYVVECPNAYPIQDKEHGESITVASLTTNRYLDKVIRAINANKNHRKNVNNIIIEFITNPPSTFISEVTTSGLTTLWNIVFFRTKNILTQEVLENILILYMKDYITQDNLFDSNNQTPIQQLPINNIMRSLGYNGIFASDRFNNGIDRGCILYDIPQGANIIGENARY